MAIQQHKTGGFRAYKKIGGVEYQLYSFDRKAAINLQAMLDKKSQIAKSLRMPKLFSTCGRLVGLRVRTYKKTNKPTFQLQFSVNGKQKKIERQYKGSFENNWKIFLKLWRDSFNLSALEITEFKSEIIYAKRLYMQDISKIENLN
jgi:hypothetical protein